VSHNIVRYSQKYLFESEPSPYICPDSLSITRPLSINSAYPHPIPAADSHQSTPPAINALSPFGPRLARPLRHHHRRSFAATTKKRNPQINREYVDKSEENLTNVPRETLRYLHQLN
jgi:hypothetical protein